MMGWRDSSLSDTKKILLKNGKQAFLKYGFNGASLRQIVRESGFTLGAFYGHFKNKEALFEALVKEQADQLIVVLESYQAVMLKDHQTFDDLTALLEQMESMYEQMIVYMISHYDTFQLILNQSKGTKYETYQEHLLAVEIASTKRYISLVNRQSDKRLDVDETFIELISIAYIKAVTSLFSCSVKPEQAKYLMSKVIHFFSCAWYKELFGS